MAAFSVFEPLILYLVLFFPGTVGQGGAVITADTVPFSAFRELSRTLTYTIPALALIWYLILRRKAFPKIPSLKPGLNDLYSFLIGFPAMAAIGILLSFIMTRFSAPLPPKIEAPENVSGWLAMALSCAGTGYLEESFFRFYLHRKMKTWSSPQWIRIVFSVFLFAICHLYEGPWGVLNAALAGFLLAVLFERYRALNGIAWAHGAYNAFVYVAAVFI